MLSLFRRRDLELVPAHLDDNEWERGVSEVHYRPLVWTAQAPTKPGWYWCRFLDDSQRAVIYVGADDDYSGGHFLWSSAPVQEPR